MTLPYVVRELCKRFSDNRNAYLGPGYKEAHLRQEFINPFFEALGWDVQNRGGSSELYKDVVHEEAIKIGGMTKAPDYSFRIGGRPVFFVEVKKPSVRLKDDPDAAFQLRRYAWSAKLPVSILTDFEEFAVYDTRIQPKKGDKAAVARVRYEVFTEYEEKWEELAALFSKEAVLKGGLDRFVQSKRLKKGTAEVDRAFLIQIEEWRSDLARNLASRNPRLDVRGLNFAVQRIIDRIVFLRICEDRGVETYGQLQSLENGSGIYERLKEIFERADDRYNSGLFHFRAEKDRHEPPDELTLGLRVDDEVLKAIIAGLYYPRSPYEFSFFPADILGQVYEQFLGKVIRLTEGHQAKVEDKPEVKKAGGVYYTPTYVVDYIVHKTVGRLLVGKTPREAAKITVLDPACGSGSFLIGAYQHLLDWHREWYTRDGVEKHKKEVFQGPGGTWRLTTTERKRILLNSIFGVDIDPQAVEVTKLSLLLKVLEGESAETINQQFKLFHERALPDLGDNIKCGNSLVEADFFDGKQMTLLEDEERARVNVFDWRREFPDVLEGGLRGFSAVIGNPPYSLVLNEEYKDYYSSRYRTTEGRFDTYELFIEKGVVLARQGGLLGFIVPSPLLTNLYTRKLRRFLLDECSIEELTNFGVDVFRDPTIHTCIIVVSHTKPRGQKVAVRKQVMNTQQLDGPYDYHRPQSEFGKNDAATFDISIDPTLDGFLTKLSKDSRPLGETYFVRQCIKTGNDELYVQKTTKPPREPWVATLRGRSIQRYAMLERDLSLKYGPWLARNWQNREFYETEKLALRETGSRLVATIDVEHRYFLSSLYAIYPKNPSDAMSLKYVLGILNSLLATCFVKLVAFDLTQGAFTKIRTNQVGRLPIRWLDLQDADERASHDRLVTLVDDMLGMQGKRNTDGGHETVEWQRQVDALDRQIDQQVYKLYELNATEIRIVEDAVGDRSGS